MPCIQMTYLVRSRPGNRVVAWLVCAAQPCRRRTVAQMAHRNVPDCTRIVVDHNFAATLGVLRLLSKPRRPPQSQRGLAKDRRRPLRSRHALRQILTIRLRPSDTTMMLSKMPDELSPPPSGPRKRSLLHLRVRGTAPRRVKAVWRRKSKARLVVFPAVCGVRSRRRPSEDWTLFGKVPHFGARPTAARRPTECPRRHPQEPTQASRIRLRQWSLPLAATATAQVRRTAAASAATSGEMATCS